MSAEHFYDHNSASHTRWREKLPKFPMPEHSLAFGDDMEGQIARSYALGATETTEETVPMSQGVDIVISERPKPQSVPRPQTIFELPQRMPDQLPRVPELMEVTGP